jgi:TRAP-type C4-dicarboxylate transport system permease small subunit
MKNVASAIEKMNSLFGFLSGFCVVCGAILIIVEIACRIVIQKSLLITDEYTGYLMALSSFLGLGYVEMQNGHIRMDLIDLLKSRFPRLIRALRFITYIIAIAFAVCLTVVCWRLFKQSYDMKSLSPQISGTPIAFLQFFLPLGAVALLLQYLVNLFKFCAEQDDTGKEMR